MEIGGTAGNTRSSVRDEQSIASLSQMQYSHHLLYDLEDKETLHIENMALKI